MLAAPPTIGEAQAGRSLPVQGTAAWNILWPTTAEPNEGSWRAGSRFSGRVGVRVTDNLYAGLSVGSWEAIVAVAFGEGPPTDTLSSLGTAVVYGGYAQLYPVRTLPVFVRGGLGLARTSTYYPTFVGGAPYILRQHATRAAPGIGAGVDIRLGSPLALSVAIDYVRLLGVTAGRELKSGLTLGVGLTLQ